MDGGRFGLFFGTLKVGVVTQIDADFPRLWGTIDYDPALSDPGSARIARFIELNRESNRLEDMEDEGITSSSRELEAINAEMETHYADFIETNEWHLVDESGKKHPILCPFLHNHGEIVWGWNVAAD